MRERLLESVLHRGHRKIDAQHSTEPRTEGSRSDDRADTAERQAVEQGFERGGILRRHRRDEASVRFREQRDVGWKLREIRSEIEVELHAQLTPHPASC